jgi:hypothetical protein
MLSLTKTARAAFPEIPPLVDHRCMMRKFFRLLILPMLAAAILPAQRRFDITPLVGFRGSESIPIAADASTGDVTAKAHLAARGTLGIAVGYRYNDQDVIEFRWIRQRTDLSFSGAVPVPHANFNARLDQYHGDFTHEYAFEDRPHVRPFIIGSVGATSVTTALSRFTRMSFGLGGGAKFFVTPRFGFRVQAQWLPIWVNPKVNGFICGGGCVVSLGGRLVSQGEVSVGPIFSF